MLSTEEQKNRLEDMLIRVQRNRIKIEKERSASAKQGPTKTAGIAAAEAEDSGRLPLPAEPSPEGRISSVPPAKKAADPVVSLESTTPYEPEPAVRRKPQPVPKPTEEPEAPEIEVMAEEPSMPPADATAEVATFVPDPDSGTVTADAPTIQPKPEVVRQVFQEGSPPPQAQPETVRVYEGEAVSSGDIAVVHGELDQSWSLGAVLTRAWKLGLSK